MTQINDNVFIIYVLSFILLIVLDVYFIYRFFKNRNVITKLKLYNVVCENDTDEFEDYYILAKSEEEVLVDFITELDFFKRNLANDGYIDYAYGYTAVISSTNTHSDAITIVELDMAVL
jgi:hypothetical protein